MLQKTYNDIILVLAKWIVFWFLLWFPFGSIWINFRTVSWFTYWRLASSLRSTPGLSSFTNTEPLITEVVPWRDLQSHHARHVCRVGMSKRVKLSFPFKTKAQPQQTWQCLLLKRTFHPRKYLGPTVTSRIVHVTSLDVWHATGVICGLQVCVWSIVRHPDASD